VFNKVTIKHGTSKGVIIPLKIGPWKLCGHVVRW